MLNTYRAGGDIHAMTTSVIFGCTYDEAQDKHRQLQRFEQIILESIRAAVRPDLNVADHHLYLILDPYHLLPGFFLLCLHERDVHRHSVYPHNANVDSRGRHNIAFESAFFYSSGIIIQAPCYDTMCAAQMTLKGSYEFRKLNESGLKRLAVDICKEPLPSFTPPPLRNCTL